MGRGTETAASAPVPCMTINRRALNPKALNFWAAKWEEETARTRHDTNAGSRENQDSFWAALNPKCPNP